MTVEALEIKVDQPSQAGVDKLLESLTQLEARLKGINSSSFGATLEAQMATIETQQKAAATAVENSMQSQVRSRAEAYNKQERMAQDQEAKLYQIRLSGGTAFEKMMQAELAARADSYAKQSALAQMQQVKLAEMQAAEAAAFEKSMQAQLAARADAYVKQKAIEEKRDMEMYLSKKHTLNFESSFAQTEIARISTDALTGQYGRLERSAFTLSNAVGFSNLLFTAQGAIIGGLVGLLAGFIYLVAKGSLEQEKLNNALVITGNYAGVTSDRLEEMATHAVAATKGIGSLGTAKDAIFELASSGRFTATQIQEIGTAATQMNVTTGAAVKSTVKEFEELAKSPVEASLKLNEKYNYLTASVLAQIDALERQGKHLEAANLAIETLANTIDQRTPQMLANMGSLEKAAFKLKEMFSEALEGWKSIGKELSTTEKVTKAYADLEEAKNKPTNYFDPSANAKAIEAATRAVEKAVQENIDFTESTKAAGVAAQERAKVDKAVAETMAYDSTRKHQNSLQVHLDAQAERDALIAKAIAQDTSHNADLAAMGTEEAIAKRRADIIKQYGPTSKSSESDAFHAEQNRIQGILKLQEQEIDQLYKIAELKYKSGEIGDVELIKASTVKTVDDLLAKIKAAKESSAAAAGTPNKTAIVEKNNAEILKDSQAIHDALETQAQKFYNLGVKREADITKNKIEELKLRGQNQAAAELEAEGTFKLTLDRLQRDLIATSADQDPAAVKALKQIQEEIDQTNKRLKAFIDDGALKDLGLKTAAVSEEVKTSLASIFDKADPTRSLTTVMDVPGLVHDLQDKLQPELEKAIAKLQEMHAADPENNKVTQALAKAQNDLRTLQDANVKAAKAVGDAWVRSGSAISTALSKAFSTSTTASAVGKLVQNYTSFVASRLEADEAYNNAKSKIEQKNYEDESTRQSDLTKLSMDYDSQKLDSSLGAMGDMASAAQGFFDAHSKGYAILGKVSQAFHLAQVAMNLVEMGQAAVIGIATQAQGEPYTAWARMAAMAAAMAALGIIVSGGMGGGGESIDNYSVKKQAAQGTGTVLGDAAAKSESIAKSLAALSANSDISLTYYQGMLTALNSINDHISGLGSSALNAISSSTVKDGAWIVSPTMPNFMMNEAPVPNSDPNVQIQILKVLDSGINIAAQTIKSIVDSGVSATKYADAWLSNFSIIRISDSVESLVKDQIGSVINSITTVVGKSAEQLGINSSVWKSALDNFVVYIGDVSLKGLSSDQIKQQLQSIFSKLGDQLAMATIPGLEAFQRQGEGGLQTLTRVANGVDQATVALKRLGVAAINYTAIANKQGDVAAEIARQSIMNAEIVQNAVYQTQQVASQVSQQVPSYTHEMVKNITTLYFEIEGVSVASQFWDGTWVDKVTTQFTTVTSTVVNAVTSMVSDVKYSGIGDILKNFTGTFQELIKLYTQLVDIRNQMAVSGLNSSNLTSSTIGGAGGVSQLASGIKSFQDKFFTASEKLQMQTALLANQFAKLGVAMPASNDAFKTLVQGIDTSTEAGQNLQGALLSLSGDFSNLTDQQTTVSATFQTTIDNLKTFKTSILDFGKSLLTGTLSTLTPLQKLAELQSQYNTDLALAKSGDAVAQSKIVSEATAYLTQSQLLNASSPAYIATLQQVQADMAELALSVDPQISAAQQQISALVSLNVTSTGILQILTSMWNSQTGSTGSQTGSTSGGTPNVFASGLPSHATGLEQVPYDNYVASLHAGEAVVDAASMAAFRRYFGSAPSGGNNDALVAEIKNLRAEVAALRADQDKQTGDIINSNYDANARAAATVAAGTKTAAQEAAWAAKTEVNLL